MPDVHAVLAPRTGGVAATAPTNSPLQSNSSNKATSNRPGTRSGSWTPYPDWYVDQLLPLLTPEEWKVVCYASRRTFGFGKEQDEISLSQFSTGALLSTGQRRDSGTGLNPETLRKCLDELHRFSVLTRVSKGSYSAGHATTWRPQEDASQVNWRGLISRRESRIAVNSRRTEKARRHITPGGSAPALPKGRSALSDSRSACCPTEPAHSLGPDLCHSTQASCGTEDASSVAQQMAHAVAQQNKNEWGNKAGDQLETQTHGGQQQMLSPPEAPGDWLVSYCPSQGEPVWRCGGLSYYPNRQQLIGSGVLVPDDEDIDEDLAVDVEGNTNDVDNARDNAPIEEFIRVTEWLKVGRSNGVLGDQELSDLFWEIADAFELTTTRCRQIGAMLRDRLPEDCRGIAETAVERNVQREAQRCAEEDGVLACSAG